VRHRWANHNRFQKSPAHRCGRSGSDLADRSGPGRQRLTRHEEAAGPPAPVPSGKVDDVQLRGRMWMGECAHKPSPATLLASGLVALGHEKLVCRRSLTINGGQHHSCWSPMLAEQAHAGARSTGIPGSRCCSPEPFLRVCGGGEPAGRCYGAFIACGWFGIQTLDRRPGDLRDHRASWAGRLLESRAADFRRTTPGRCGCRSRGSGVVQMILIWRGQSTRWRRFENWARARLVSVAFPWALMGVGGGQDRRLSARSSPSRPSWAGARPGFWDGGSRRR